MPEMKMIHAWHITALKAFAVSMGMLVFLGFLFKTDSGRIIQTVAFGPVLLLFPEQTMAEGFNPAGILCLSAWCCLTAWRLKRFWVYPLSIVWIVAGFASLISNMARILIT